MRQLDGISLLSLSEEFSLALPVMSNVGVLVLL